MSRLRTDVLECGWCGRRAPSASAGPVLDTRWAVYVVQMRRVLDAGTALAMAAEESRTLLLCGRALNLACGGVSIGGDGCVGAARVEAAVSGWRLLV